MIKENEINNETIKLLALTIRLRKSCNQISIYVNVFVSGKRLISLSMTGN